MNTSTFSPRLKKHLELTYLNFPLLSVGTEGNHINVALSPNGIVYYTN